MGGTMGVQRDIWKMYDNLEKGEYYIFAEVDWIDQVDLNDYALSVYGVEHAYLIRDDKNMFKRSEILQQTLTSCALKQLEGCKHTTYETLSEPNIHKYTQLLEEGYGFTLYDNQSKESTLNEKVNFTKFDGL